MSTAASSASVEIKSAPAGVTCCQRMSPLGLIVHTAVAPAGAGAAVWARSVVSGATQRESSSVPRSEIAIMVNLRWPPISPHEPSERKPRRPPCRTLELVNASSRHRYRAFVLDYKRRRLDDAAYPADAARAARGERRAYLHEYLRWLRPYRNAAAALLVLALLTTGLQMIEPLFMRFIID